MPSCPPHADFYRLNFVIFKCRYSLESCHNAPNVGELQREINNTIYDGRCFGYKMKLWQFRLAFPTCAFYVIMLDQYDCIAPMGASVPLKFLWILSSECDVCWLKHMPSLSIIIIILVMNIVIVSMYGLQPDYYRFVLSVCVCFLIESTGKLTSVNQKLLRSCAVRHQKSFASDHFRAVWTVFSFPPALIRKKLNNPSLPIPPSVSAD